MECKIPIKCPVCGNVFFASREDIARNEIKCPHCGAVLVLMPKNPNVMLQSLLYKELMILLRKVERELFGDRNG